jgi:hypothetical protein|tara:strand:- start:54 stop:1505 length:1452 start_codon:yes stop_codon:yes gene_type:complete
MSSIVQYGGAAHTPHTPHQQEDNDRCYGQRKQIEYGMDKVAMLMIASAVPLAQLSHTIVSNNPYTAGSYAQLTSAFGTIYDIINETSIQLVGRRDQCTSFYHLALGAVGAMNCEKGEARMQGYFNMIIKWFEQRLGNTALFKKLIESGGILAVFTMLRKFITSLLTNLMCGLYYGGGSTLIGTWVVAKIILQTIASFVKDGSYLMVKTAVAIGGELFGYIMTLGTWHQKNKEYLITNDTPTIENVETNIASIDNAHNVVDRLSTAGDDLEAVEETYDDGDAIIENYIEDEQQVEEDFVENDAKMKAMKDYLLYAIEASKEGGPDYNDHLNILNEYKHLSGKWRPPNDFYDMGEAEDVSVSQPYDQTDWEDTDVDPHGYTLKRASTYGGIVNKKNSVFIKKINMYIKKNLNKIKFSKKKSKSKGLTPTRRAGYKYKYKNKDTKKKRGIRNRAGFASKMTRNNKSWGLGKGTRFNRRKSRRRKGN